MEEVEVTAKRIVNLLDRHATDDNGRLDSELALALVTASLTAQEGCDEVPYLRAGAIQPLQLA